METELWNCHGTFGVFGFVFQPLKIKVILLLQGGQPMTALETIERDCHHLGLPAPITFQVDGSQDDTRLCSDFS